MNHPSTPLYSAVLGLALVAPGTATAAPDITPGPVIDVCGAGCTPIGGVGLAGDQLGILVDESGVATWVVFDRTTGAEVSSTILGNSAGFGMQDVASDNSGGAWMVGFSDVGGQSTPGRWHTDDLTTRQTPSGLNGGSDLLLTAVASDGTAFGASATDFATRILPNGTAVDMVAGLTTELPTSISDSTADAGAAVGSAQAGGVLTLAGWNGDTLSFQDTVAGGNGVIGRRMDGALVIVGIRIAGLSAQIGAFTDPFGVPGLTTVSSVSSAELSGMDHYDFGYAYGSVEGEAAFVDTNSMEVVMLADAGISGYDNLVSMDYLGGTDWLLTLSGSAHYMVASISTGGVDTDGDGVPDSADNCQLVSNVAQVDANGDQIGNFCDADFNDDCIVNAVDLGILKLNFFTTNPVVDINSNGIVNAVDLGLFKGMFFAPAGPGLPGNSCE